MKRYIFKRYRANILFFGILAIIFLIFAVLLVAELANCPIGLQPIHWITISVALLASTQWALTSRLTYRNARMQHTMNILLQSRLSAAYQQKMQDVIDIYPLFPTPAKIDIEDLKDPSKRKGIEGIKYLLNFFEFMAIGIQTGDLDEEILYQSLSHIVTTLAEVGNPFIAYCQGRSEQEEENDNVYGSLCWLKKRWKPRMKKDGFRLVAIDQRT